MKFASLFSGGGGSDLGAIAAGLTHAWGLEYDPQIADVYRQNIGECHVLDILEANPHDFEPVDWLHASPVCKAFSSANAKAGEKQWDIDCGRCCSLNIFLWRMCKHTGNQKHSSKSLTGFIPLAIGHNGRFSTPLIGAFHSHAGG